jgi:hypothetical protein
MPAWCNSSTWDFDPQGTGAIPEAGAISDETIRLEVDPGVLRPRPLDSRVHGKVRILNGFLDEGEEARRLHDTPETICLARNNPGQQRHKTVGCASTIGTHCNREAVSLRRLRARPGVERQATCARGGSRGRERYRPPARKFRISMPELSHADANVGLSRQELPCSSGVERRSLKPDVLGANPSVAATLYQQ